MVPDLPITTHTSHHHSHRLSGGFTLIELLVGIALMGIIAGFTIPQLNGLYERQKLSNGANELVDALNRARNLALSNYQPAALTQVLIDCDNNTSGKTRKYIDGYSVIFTDPPGSDGVNYAISEKVRSFDKNGVACSTTSESSVVSKSLPVPVKAFATNGSSASGIRINFTDTNGVISGLPSGALIVATPNLTTTYNCVYVPANGAPVYTINKSGNYGSPNPCP